jgi:hypothetical protein
MQPWLQDPTPNLERQLFLANDFALGLIFVHTLLFMVYLIKEFFKEDAQVTRAWSHLLAVTWSLFVWAWVWNTHPWLYSAAVRATNESLYQGMGIGMSLSVWTSQIQQRGWLLAILATLGCALPLARILTLLLMDHKDEGRGRMQVVVMSLTVFLSLYLIMCLWSTEIVHVRLKACLPGWCVTPPQCAFGVLVSVVGLIIWLLCLVAVIRKYEMILELVHYHTMSWLSMFSPPIWVNIVGVAQLMVYYLCILLLLLIGWSLQVATIQGGGSSVGVRRVQSGLDILLILSIYAMTVNTAHQCVLLASYVATTVCAKTSSPPECEHGSLASSSLIQ